MAMWFLLFPVNWIVTAALTFEDVWLAPIGLALIALIVFVIVRCMHMETLLIGSSALRRVGILKTRSIAWAEVTGTEKVTRVGTRGRRIELLNVIGEKGALLIAPHQVADPHRVLYWALDQAKNGKASAIGERVLQEGAELQRWRWYIPHAAVALVLSCAMTALFVSDIRKKQTRHELERITQMSDPAEKIPAALALAVDADQERSARCRAYHIMMYSHLALGQLPEAATACEPRVALACGTARAQCEEVRRLGEAHAAMAASNPTEALQLLEAVPRLRPAIRFDLEVRALQAVGRDADAILVAEQCIQRFGASQQPQLMAYAATCRAALPAGSPTDQP